MSMVPERGQARANPARGLALIATAVVLGFFLLRNGWDQNVPDVPAADASENADNGGQADGAAADDSTTSSTAPARAPGEVTVFVANASGVNGAAATLTDNLETERGYRIVPAGNAQGPVREATVVLYQAGFEAEAARLSEEVAASEPPVALANPPQAGIDPAGANLVVLLGSDIAEGLG